MTNKTGLETLTHGRVGTMKRKPIPISKERAKAITNIMGHISCKRAEIDGAHVMLSSLLSVGMDDIVDAVNACESGSQLLDYFGVEVLPGGSDVTA